MGVKVLLFTDMGDIEYLKSVATRQLATQLRLNGYSTQVVDHFTYLTMDQILAVIDKFVDADTIAVGFSSTFMAKRADNKLRRTNVSFLPRTLPLSPEDGDLLRAKILSKSPKAKLIKGGVNANLKNESYIDTFIIGYADKMLVDYVKYLDKKNPFFQYRPKPLDKDGHISGQIIIDTDIKGEAFDFVNSSVKWEDCDLVDHNEPLPIEISRGCIFRCKFCSYPLNGKKKMDFIKEPDVLRDEMLRNYDKFGTTQYLFTDDTFNDSVYKLDLLGNMIAKLPFKLKFTTYLRHDLIWSHKEMADMLLEMGLVAAQFGIETLNHESGKVIGKGLHPNDTIELLTWLRNEKWGNKILTNSNFILGLPRETYASMQAWIDILLKPEFPLHTWQVKPFMLSYISPARLAKMSRDKNLFLSEISINSEKYGYGFPNLSTQHGKHQWSNDLLGTTYDGVKDLCTDTMMKQKGQYFSNWKLMSMQNLGYAYEDLHSKPRDAMNYTIADRLERREALVARYYKKLLQLP